MAPLGVALLIALTLGGCQCFCTESAGTAPGDVAVRQTPSGTPVHVVGQDAHIRHWFVLGPFPNPDLEKPLDDGSLRAGYGKDYLTSLGEEAWAVLTSQTAVVFSDEEGKRQTARSSPGGTTGRERRAIPGHESSTVPPGLDLSSRIVPTVETVGCYRLSLRDKTIE
ncbi:hypothetical protein JW916_12440 [Candidatus Sumerlaeota bacterium]|nr:hypothetical protein [Candidatus Sumerlaeota bacterium]